MASSRNVIAAVHRRSSIRPITIRRSSWTWRDGDPSIVQPEHLRRFEVDPMLGDVRRAFLRIELEGHISSIAEIRYKNYTY